MARRPWYRLPRWDARQAELTDAQAAVSESARRMVRSTSLALAATDMAVRLSNHRAENHFSQRIEELFKENRA